VALYISYFFLQKVYFTLDTVDTIQEIIIKGKAKEMIKVPVYHYPTP
jgi:hypothetical protein